MGRFGEATKLNASEETRSIYDMFVERKLVGSFADLFQLSAAIGISFGERKPLEKKAQIGNPYSIDKESVFSTLLEEMYPQKTPEQRLDTLEEYAEVGIRYLKQEYEKYGAIDWQRLVNQLVLEKH